MVWHLLSGRARRSSLLVRARPLPYRIRSEYAVICSFRFISSLNFHWDEDRAFLWTSLSTACPAPPICCMMCVSTNGGAVPGAVIFRRLRTAHVLAYHFHGPCMIICPTLPFCPGCWLLLASFLAYPSCGLHDRPYISLLRLEVGNISLSLSLLGR